MIDDKECEIQEYVKRVCEKISWQEAHPQVKAELAGHMEDIAAELKREGAAEKDAIHQAVLRMGNPEMVGEELGKTHVPQRNMVLAGTMAFLSGVGLLIMYMLGQSGADPFLFFRSLLFMGLGIGAIIALYRYDGRKIQDCGGILYLGTLLAGIATVIWGTHSNGKIFLQVGPVALDCISVTPYFFTVSLAALLSDYAGKTWWEESWRGDIGAALLLIAPVGMYSAAGSSFLAVLYMAAFLVLMHQAGAGIRRLGTIAFLVFCAGMTGWIHLSGNMSLLDGNPVSTAAFHTDYVFSCVLQTGGWTAGGVVIAACGAFVWAMVRSAGQMKDSFGKKAVSGITVCYMVQMGWHVLMSLGLAPEVPVNLPFISFGGSQSIVHMAALGLVLSLYKRKNLTKHLRRVG